MRKHVDALDGLRGVAIALVVLHHLHAFTGAHAGTEIFFTLSGYLVTKKFDSARQRMSWSYIRDFYKRRFIRLVPPLAALLGIFSLFCVLFPSVDSTLARSLVAVLTNTMNIQLSLNIFKSYSLVHLWSLSAEQQFYLIWPLLLFALPRHLVKPTLLALLGLTSIWRVALWYSGATEDRLYFGLDTHADGLIIGSLLAMSAIPTWLRPWLQRSGPFLLAGVVAISMIPWFAHGETVVETPVLALASAALIASASSEGLLASMLSFYPIRYLGLISYSLYLWHYPVIQTISLPWQHGRAAVKLALSLLAATLAYVIVERPLLARKRSQAKRSTLASVEQPADLTLSVAG